MERMIYVNLPVSDLDRSKTFFNTLGFPTNEAFTNEDAACITVSGQIYLMLLKHAFFKQFTPLEIADANKTTEVLVCLSCETRGEVDELADKAISAGGADFREPMDYGFMYGRSFKDPDGHIFELSWMDPSAIAENKHMEIELATR